MQYESLKGTMVVIVMKILIIQISRIVIFLRITMNLLKKKEDYFYIETI